jgi:hypothetical protein
MTQNITITNAAGTIATIHPKGFGSIAFMTESGRRILIWFHFNDSDGTAFELKDKVSFDLGTDGQHRTRAYNVKLIEAYKPPTVGRP